MAGIIGGITGSIGGLLPSFIGGKTDASEGGLDGKKLGHWSITVLRVAAGAGVIAAIVAAVVGQYFMAAGFGVLGITDFLGSYYLKEFLPLQSIEDTIDEMEDTVSKIVRVTGQVDKAGDKLENAVKIQTENISRYRQIVNRAKKVSTQLKSVAGEVQAATKQKNSLASKQQKLIKESMSVANTLERIAKHLEDREKGLTDQVQFLDNIRQELSNQNNIWLDTLQDFDEENAELAEHLKRQGNLNRTLKEDLDLAMNHLTDHRKKMAREFDELREVEKERSEVTAQRKEVTDKLHRIEETRAENIKRLESLLNRADRLLSEPEIAKR